MDEFTKRRHLGERPTRGRPFAKGNPGRKPGSKNKTTVIGQALLKEAEDRLVRKAIEIAEAGDGPMLKFLLDRILPKERAVDFDINLHDGDFDPVEAMRSIFEAVATGQIAPGEAAALTNTVGGYTRSRGW